MLTIVSEELFYTYDNKVWPVMPFSVFVDIPK